MSNIEWIEVEEDVFEAFRGRWRIEFTSGRWNVFQHSIGPSGESQGRRLMAQYDTLREGQIFVEECPQ